MFDQLSGAVPGPSSTSSGGATSSLGGASGPPPFAPPFAPVPMPSLDAPGEQGARGGSEGGAEAGRGAASLLPGSLQHPDDAQASANQCRLLLAQPAALSLLWCMLDAQAEREG